MNTRTHAEFSDFDSAGPVELSIVLTLCNGAGAVHPMHQRLTAVMAAQGIRYELLFINDGSTDSTAGILSTIAAEDPHTRTLSLTRHAGRESALATGLARATGQAVIIMDADLCDPPEYIPQMLAAWRAGTDVVRMRPCRNTRRPMLARLGARCLDHTLDAIGVAPLPENRIDFMLFNRKAVDALSLAIERKRDMARLFNWMGLKQTTIDYERAPRANTWTPARRLAL
ncbi:MAG: glycosyltransferase family 2 protein [Alcaligenaceae bacterium]|nr:glycosyltransferase family 2 protein [Alcaligenaceae bacterium]